MKRLALLALLACAAPAGAIDQIRLRAESVAMIVPEFGEIAARQVDAKLTLRTGGRSRFEATAARLSLPAAVTQHTGALTRLQLRCDNPRIHEPDFACPALTAKVRAARLPPLALRARVALRSDTGKATAAGEIPQIAGATLAFDAQQDDAGLRATLRLPDVEIPELRKLLAPRFTLPEDFTLAGRSSITANLQRRAGRMLARMEMTLGGLAFQNGAATWIAEKVDATLVAEADLTASPLTFDATVDGRHGQFLGGLVLLDFEQNPLQVRARGAWSADGLRIAGFTSRQEQLASARGSADVGFAPFEIRRADVEIDELTFPAAYTSYLQLLLATTPFNQLATGGRASGRLAIENNAPVAADLALDGLTFHDESRALRVEGVTSAVHWTAGIAGPARPSFLAWESSRGFGFEGARTRLDFATHDRSFQLLKPARLPLFDGALVINTLTAANFGLDSMEGAFDATIEPISVQRLAKAMGWPEFQGRLAGRIPGLTYKDRVLTLSGNLEADVFDGRVVASNLRVRDPLSAWRRLHADVTARNLDLDLITRTFEFGSITGRLDVDLLGLETFNWSPTAFDLRMATPRGDRSRRRISQKAVQNLSNIGGGGGGVATALQGGLLQFFEDFGYQRIGLSCRLRNDVCLMDGVGKANSGYYIVKGSGLPRINIIGSPNRVDWPRLVSQVRAALANTGDVVVN